MLFSTFFLLLNVFALSSSTIVLKPTTLAASTGQDVALILVPGASIESKFYTKFFQTLQTKYPGLWVAMTEFTFSTPNPIQINDQINKALEQLKNSGLNYTKETPLFFVGHSLGGVFLQDYVLSKVNQDALPVRVAGLVLEGSYIVRKNYDLVKNAAVPALLTISGELDGLNRISRVAETVYFDAKDANRDVQRMTYVIPGKDLELTFN